MPKVDINSRDCDVRSLAELEPDRHVFAKLKHLLRKAAAHSAETICVTIGEILRAFTPNRMRQLFPKLRLCPILKESCSRVKTQLTMLRFNGLVNRIGGPTDAGELVLV